MPVIPASQEVDWWTHEDQDWDKVSENLSQKQIQIGGGGGWWLK
jgi:hypothetical protein